MEVTKEPCRPVDVQPETDRAVAVSRGASIQVGPSELSASTVVFGRSLRLAQ